MPSIDARPEGCDDPVDVLVAHHAQDRETLAIESHAAEVAGERLRSLCVVRHVQYPRGSARQDLESTWQFDAHQAFAQCVHRHG